MVTRSFGVVYPFLGICCVICILFAITTTIVLAFIPIYLPGKTVKPADPFPFKRKSLFSAAVPQAMPLGPITPIKIAELLNVIQRSSAACGIAKNALKIKTAEVVYTDQITSDRKQQEEYAKTLKLTIIVGAENVAIIEKFQITVEKVIEEDELSDFIESVIEDDDTDVPSTVTTNSNEYYVSKFLNPISASAGHH